MDLKGTLILLDLILTGIERSAAVYAKMIEVRDFVQDKVNRGERVTDEEWAALRDRLNLAELTLERRAAEAREILANKGD